MRNAYLSPANIDVSVKRLHNFCIDKMVISREDGMLIRYCVDGDVKPCSINQSIDRKVMVQRSY